MNNDEQTASRKRIAELSRISRAVSHALRHEPWLYELELDAEGWAPVEDLVSALRSEKRQWAALTADDLATMIAVADKQRYELRDGRIRALYGHSLPERLKKTPGTPPATLFHGTSPAALPAIRSSGLSPMSRHHVHLSVDLETATAVGRRKSATPTILRVQAGQASEQGVQFYIGNDKVWLADHVPAEFIEFGEL